MNARVLVTREADVANFAGAARVDQRGVCAVRVEDAVGVIEANDLVVLHQVDVIRLQPPQGFIELACCFLPRATVDLRHHERTIAISVAQRFADADLTRALPVVPGIVDERDALVDRLPDDANREILVDLREAEMPAAEPDRRDPLAGAAERAVHRTVGRRMVGHCRAPHRKLGWALRAIDVPDMTRAMEPRPVDRRRTSNRSTYRASASASSTRGEAA